LERELKKIYSETKKFLDNFFEQLLDNFMEQFGESSNEKFYDYFDEKIFRLEKEFSQNFFTDNFNFFSTKLKKFEYESEPRSEEQTSIFATNQPEPQTEDYYEEEEESPKKIEKNTFKIEKPLELEKKEEMRKEEDHPGLHERIEDRQIEEEESEEEEEEEEEILTVEELVLRNKIDEQFYYLSQPNVTGSLYINLAELICCKDYKSGFISGQNGFGLHSYEVDDDRKMLNLTKIHGKFSC
jgi:hypothetical protein